MEYGAFLFHKLKNKQLQKLKKIKYRAILGALSYRSSTPTNIMLAEAKEIQIFCSLKHLGRNYVSRCYTSMAQLLEELSILFDNPGRVENEQPLISGYYREVTPFGHLIQSGNCSLPFNYTYDSLFYEAKVSFDEGRQLKEAEEHNEELKNSTKKWEPVKGSPRMAQNGEQTIRRIRINTYK
jgi:hypothetical protein